MRSSLAPLLDVDLAGLPLAAAPDPWEPHHQARGREFWEATGSAPSAVYFNSGVMVIDPAAWRALEISKQVQALVADPGFPTRSVGVNRRGRARIVHFVGDAKPWNVRTPVSLFQRDYEALARSIGWKIDSPGEQRVRRFARSLAPVGLLERLRWRYPR